MFLFLNSRQIFDFIYIFCLLWILSVDRLKQYVNWLLANLFFLMLNDLFSNSKAHILNCESIWINFYRWTVGAVRRFPFSYIKSQPNPKMTFITYLSIKVLSFLIKFMYLFNFHRLEWMNGEKIHLDLVLLLKWMLHNHFPELTPMRIYRLKMIHSTQWISIKWNESRYGLH